MFTEEDATKTTGAGGGEYLSRHCQGPVYRYVTLSGVT